MAFSADGKLLFVGGLDQIDVYDVTMDPPELTGSIPMEGADINNIATLPCSAATSESVIKVAVDIKPGSCPNPLNVKSKGILPVAIPGTDDVDVTQIDPDSILLAGLPPLRWDFEDVATPYDADTTQDDCLACSQNGPDGVLDLTLKFNKQHIVAAIGSVSDGECMPMEISGEFWDGTSIVGADIVRIKAKKK